MLNTSQKSQKNVLFLLTVLLVLISIVGCAPKQPATQSMVSPPAEPPTTIELDSSRVNDLLQDGDIPEEGLGDLSWLPQRPPIGMTFQKNPALQTVYFEFDKFSLTRQTREVLDANAEWLRENSAAFVQIEGHCDERGTLDYNQVLGGE